MQVDGGLFGDLGKVPERARLLEASGYDGAFSAEVSSDPFFPFGPLEPSTPNASNC